MFHCLANTVQGSSNNLPSTVTVHNLNHMLHLFYSCCHADKSHYLQVAKAMMDQLAPSVVPDHVAWPTREHFKYYMETCVSIINPHLLLNSFDCGVLSSVVI